MVILLNNGLGGFHAPVRSQAQHAGYEDLEVGDVSGDGRDDLVVMSGQGYAVPNVSVLQALSTGGFGPAAEYRVGTNVNTSGIGVGDVTGDGRKDVVASYGGNRPTSFVAVFAQTATGTLAAPVSYPSYDIPEPVEVADLDRDGRSDVVTLHGGWNRAGVYRGQGGGTLAVEELYAILYASHYNPHGLAVGDIDGNGSPDLAIADYNQGLVVLRNTTSPPQPPPSADLGVDVTAGREPRQAEQALLVRRGGHERRSGSVDCDAHGAAERAGLGSRRSGAGCTLAGQTATCTFQAMAAGTSKTVQVYGTAKAKGTLVADATVAGNGADPNGGNDRDSASIMVH